MFQTEHEFTLPMGLLSDDGTLHRDGAMRLATAADEILPLRDPRVEKNPAYLTVVLLSRVITRLGPQRELTPKDVEGLFSADLAYLQDLYNEINRVDGEASAVTCPECSHDFEVERPFVSTSGAIPSTSSTRR
jgi:hypothetical protein